MKKLLILGLMITGSATMYAQEGDNRYESIYRYYFYKITNEYPKNIPANLNCWQLKGDGSSCYAEGKRDGTYAGQQYMLNKNKEEKPGTTKDRKKLKSLMPYNN